MKVLLLGRGWVGRRFAERIQLDGHSISMHGVGQDLTAPQEVQSLMLLARLFHPDAIVYSAANYGGIAYVSPRPWTLFDKNLRMGLGAVQVWQASQAPLLVLVGTACSYPEWPSFESIARQSSASPVAPFTVKLDEDSLHSGLPHESVEGYGLAKRTVERAAVLALREHSRTEKGVPRRIVHLILANLYGPGDHYDPVKAHAPAAILMRAVCAARFEDCRPMTCWGTGEEVRDLLYIDDAVDGIARAVERPLPGPLARINLGSGRGVTTREIAIAAITAVAMAGGVQFSGGGPGAQAVKILDVAAAERLLDWHASTPLSMGMAKAHRALAAAWDREDWIVKVASDWQVQIRREQDRAVGEKPRGTA